jgi:xanthine dehydrogenase accessory factor
MKEIERILQLYHKKNDEGLQMALATVVDVRGSSYRRTGARMLIVENGEWIGGVSGGCIEGDLLKKAKNVIFNQKAVLITYDTTENDPYQIGVGLGCHGVIDILIAPLNCSVVYHPLKILQNCSDNRRISILFTIISNSTKIPLEEGEVLLLENNPLSNKIQNCFKHQLSNIIESQKSQLAHFNESPEHQISVFIEVIQPKLHLCIFGSQYDIYPLIDLAEFIGWKVTLIADLLKINKNIVRKLNGVFSRDSDLINKTDARTAIIIMTHDYKKDLQILRKYLLCDVAYIGLLGPRKRGDKLLQLLIDDGVTISQQQLNKIHSPVGLDIGAVNPEEIALSVVAEIQAFFNNRKAEPLRLRKTSIHNAQE